MSQKFFYVYIVAGVIFVGVSIYNWLFVHADAYVIILDAFIALLLFYRGYRIYLTKNDQELM